MSWLELYEEMADILELEISECSVKDCQAKSIRHPYAHVGDEINRCMNCDEYFCSKHRIMRVCKKCECLLCEEHFAGKTCKYCKDKK